MPNSACALSISQSAAASAVVRSGRERMLGREPVVDADHGDACGLGDLPVARVHGQRGAHRHSATVVVEIDPVDRLTAS